MINFKRIASETLANCPLMVGRTKVSTNDILSQHSDFVTIISFDFAKSTQGLYGVCELAEYPNSYYPCGMALTGIFNQWLNLYNGDIELCNSDLRNSNGVKVKLERVRTGKGNQFIKVSVL